MGFDWEGFVLTRYISSRMDFCDLTALLSHGSRSDLSCKNLWPVMACCCSLIFIVENFLPTDSDLGRFGTCNVFFRTYGYLCCWSAQYSIISSLLGAIYPNLLLSIRRLHSNPVCFMISLRTLLYIIFMLDLTNLLIRFSITNKSIGVDWRLCILIL